MSFQPQPLKICLRSSLLTHRNCLSNLTSPKYTSTHLHRLPPNHNKSLLIPTQLKYTPLIQKKYLLASIYQPKTSTRTHTHIRTHTHTHTHTNTHTHTHTLPKNTLTHHHQFRKSETNPSTQHILLITHKNVHPPPPTKLLVSVDSLYPIVKDSIFCY